MWRPYQTEAVAGLPPCAAKMPRRGVVSGACDPRLIRRGSSSPAACRSAARIETAPSSAFMDAGSRSRTADRCRVSTRLCCRGSLARPEATDCLQGCRGRRYSGSIPPRVRRVMPCAGQQRPSHSFKRRPVTGREATTGICDGGPIRDARILSALYFTVYPPSVSFFYNRSGIGRLHS